ncbi:MAG: transcription repressor NadR [Peptococcaceae bacterium]|nr:transcription repressor NadR [Peptococcaceae bacterium]MBO5139812.1 transcription repressor NadR [Peptococcaceae bacterium]MBO5302087.1 transcription repressor NadR [Peptococcaceae bacterium]
MTGTERREFIVNHIKNSKSPVPGKALAELCDVSRQVIVQDMALIRTAGYDIISTNRGYIIQNGPSAASRIFKVQHTDEQMEDELTSIVDLGGNVVNVMVHHKAYGHMEAPLGINSRKKVQDFVATIKSGKSSPLKNITSNYHYHNIEAENEETLDLIEQMLKQKGFLIEP